MRYKIDVLLTYLLILIVGYFI